MSKGKRYSEEQINRVLKEIEAAPSFPSFAVEKELEWLFLVHRKTQKVVSDNGPEFRALNLPDGVEAGFIPPGKPWQNGRVESFFDKLRDERLRGAIFSSGDELQASLDEFQDHYNHHRPHRSLGLLTPQDSRKVSRQENRRRKLLTL